MRGKIGLVQSDACPSTTALLCWVHAVVHVQDVVPKKAIILFTDVFGVGPPNAQLMADKFASEGGFLVAVPDLFGDSAPSPATMDRMVQPPFYYALCRMLF
jgi:hypothetical protein